MKMIQKKLLSSSSANANFGCMLIQDDLSLQKFFLPKLTGHYLCIVVFRSALEESSSKHYLDFAQKLNEFYGQDCEVVGLLRESSMVIQEWMKSLASDSDKLFPCISDLHIGERNSYGLIQSIGIPLVHGCPIPSIILTDRNGKVRYVSSFATSDWFNVSEVLRVVSALKMVDDCGEKKLAPCDWEQDLPSMQNSPEGVLEFYRSKEGKHKGSSVAEIVGVLLEMIKIGSHSAYKGIW